MQAPHLELGRDAEDAALGYFLARTPSARLVERNCRFRWGEIDLIFEECDEGECAEGDCDEQERGRARELVFVEVRARSGGGLARGFETIGPVKRRRLRKAIGLFLARYSGPARSLRVDVLSWDSGEWTWLRNVWI